MKINDRIYGRIEIDNPLILELIASNPFQRLKKLNQYGGVNLVYPSKYQVSRFEHSIGVWHILKTLGASLEVQAAGLLHDIGHTAFSHMVDMALQNTRENFHELNIHRIKNFNQLMNILKKYHLSLKKIDDYREVKRSLPDIGADRLDYAVRDYVGATGQNRSLGKKVIKSIKLMDHNIVFSDLSVAKMYAITGLRAMWHVVYEPKVAVVYQAIVEIIRRGFGEKWLSENDLFEDDKTVLKIILNNKSRLDTKYINIFTKRFSVKEGTAVDFDFHHTKNKIRYFDPLILWKGIKKHLSEVDKTFSKQLKNYLKIFESRKKGTYYKVTFS